MGKGHYLGGGSLLNVEAGFKSYDPAEKQSRTYVSSGPAYSPVRPSLKYTIQVQEQIRILLRHIANGKKKPYIPHLLKEEISEFDSLLEWARTKPAYGEINKERLSRSKVTDRAKKAAGRKPKAKKGSIGRMEPPKKAAAEKCSGVIEEQVRSPAEVLADLEAVLKELAEDRKSPWYSEGKKQAITERYHSVKKKYDTLWLQFHERLKR